MDVTGERHRGLLTGARPGRPGTPAWRRRSTYDYQGLTVCKTGPWGQGPVFLQQLALLSGFDLHAAMEPGSAEFIHIVTECAKLAFADREAWYGDPDFTDVPLERAARQPRTTTSGASSSPTPRARSCRPGLPGGREIRAAGLRHASVRDLRI